MSTPPTIWEHAALLGHSRRDFLKFCSWLAAAAGLESSQVVQVVHALETKPRLPVVWFHFQECTCCSESFIRSSHPIVSDVILDKISLDYTQTLQAAAGKQCEEALQQTMTKYKGEYLMMVEGSIPTGEDGAYCCINGRTALEIVREAAQGAKAIIAWGSCASNGCIQAAKPNPTGATPVHKIITDKPIIKVPGCPPIGEVMAATVVHLLAFDTIPKLDRIGRPMAFYSRRVHDTCYRRPNYDAGLVGLGVQGEEATHHLVGFGQDALVHALAKFGERFHPVIGGAHAPASSNSGSSLPARCSAIMSS